MNRKLAWSNIIIFLDAYKIYQVLELYFLSLLKIGSHEASLSTHYHFYVNLCYSGFYYLYGILIH